MKQDTINGGSSVIFTNIQNTIHINPSFYMEVELQIIFGFNKDGELIQDGFEVNDISKIHYMGVDITDYDDLRKFIDYHKEMGIKLYDIADERSKLLLDQYKNDEILQLFGSVRVVKKQSRW
jgi:hypothetical protein